MHKYFKHIAVVLLITMLTTLFPLNAFADEIKKQSAANTPKLKFQENADSKILGEVTQKRGKYVKQFRKEDGSFEADVYNVPIHYLENGQWQDIDNSLADSKDEENNDILENKKNDFMIKIAKKSKSKKLVKIQKDKYEISWNIENPNDIKPTVITDNNENYNSLSENDKKRTLKNLSSKVEFKNIYQDIDLQYKIFPNQVKENIILNKNIDNPKFNFNINAKNLNLKLLEDNSIVFYDDKTSKEVFKMQSPVMFDANGIVSSAGDVVVTLSNDKGEYLLSITPNNGWLNSPDRAYPVTIDPPIATSIDATSVSDSSVSSKNPGANYQGSALLRTGNNSTYGISRTYLKFELPELTSSDFVTKAYLFLTVSNNPTGTANQINVHRVSANWNESTITWNNKPAYNPKVEEYLTVQSNKEYMFDITGIAKDWYTTGVNYGLMVKDSNETTAYNEYYSCDATADHNYNKPQVSIKYVNNSGLEDYWTYHSQDAGRAGTGYINDYNGNLTFIHNDLDMNGNKMPVSISHVYNANESGIDMKYGYGWRLNLSQRIAPQTINGRQYYVYTDEDSTEHYFSLDTATNTYIDESGLNLKLIKNADGTYVINRPDGSRLIFTSGGYLNYIKDSNGNTLTLKYMGTTLSKLTDGAGRVTNLESTTAGYLIGIIDPSGRRTSFSYNGTQLYKITYPDGKYTLYSYDSNNRLLSAANYDGYKVTYSYYGVKPYRIKSVSEMGTDSTQGQSLNLSYGYNTTSFTDGNGRKSIYQFNDFGNTVSIRDNDGSAKYYKYYTSGAAKNKLSNESKLEKTVVNYLKNHNFEVSSNWSLDKSDTSTGSADYTTEDKYIGSQGIKVNKDNGEGYQAFSQDVSLEKGKTYTLSGYIKTKDVSNSNNKGAALAISYKDANGNTKTINSEYVNGAHDWERYEVTFTLPDNAASSTVGVKTLIEGEGGTAYFDCLQLEDGKIANRYNIIENSDIKYVSGGIPEFWNRNEFCDNNDAATSSVNAPGSTSSSFKINGVFNKDKNINQRINMPGKAGDVFTVSGWAKGDSVPISGYRYFALDVGFESYDGTYQFKVVPFNEDSTDWQYVSDRVSPSVDYKSVVVYCIYYDNANTAYFDNVQLYKEEFEEVYSYDSNSNLASSEDLMHQKSTFVNNSNNETTQYTDAEGNTSNFDYDGTGHNLQDATSPEGVKNSFTYDNFGNVTSSTVQGGDISLKSLAAYTSDGNYLKEETNPSGNQTQYSYNTTKGILDSIIDPKGSKTSYSYDNMDRLTSVSKNVDGSSVTNSYEYENDALKKISHNGFSYIFNYDPFGNVKDVSVGNQNLITNNYDSKRGNLLESVYGNGQSIQFSYDDMDRIASEKFNGTERFRYSYDSEGNLGLEEDLVNDVNYRYVYDLSGRIVKIIDSKGNVTSYGYDGVSNTAKVTEKIGSSQRNIGYSYDGDNNLKNISIDGNKNISYKYDPIGRISSVSYISGGINAETKYSYDTGGKLSSVTLPSGNIISYSYDKNGNIETITDGGKVIKYYYNEANELTREDNQVEDKTIVYSYDAGGNIKDRKEYKYTADVQPQELLKSDNYAYGDNNWKDKLTQYNDKNLTYDEIGNILNDGTYSYTWEEGRQLKSISGENLDISFKYNSDGIRTEKTVNGITTKYHVVDGKVTYETNGEDKIYYTYDNGDNLVSMNLNGTEYYYVRNGQGDIIGLLDEAGKQVVSYSYNSWGKLLSIDGDLKDTVGVKNPYRYRGYRYDSETGLYYLQSRYYNPELGKFINADDISLLPSAQDELLRTNLFMYCGNNPVNNFDPSGYSWVGNSWNWVKSHWRGIPNWLLAGAIDSAITIYSGWKAITGIKAIRKLLRENRTKITRIVERQIMKYVGSVASTIAKTAVNLALNLAGASIGGIITLAIDNYIDPLYGAKKRNKYCFG